MTTDTQVTTLLDSQRTQAGEVLGRAFFDDPLMEYIFPEEARRERPVTLATRQRYSLFAWLGPSCKELHLLRQPVRYCRQ